LPVIQPAQVPHGAPHVLIGSTGLQVYGAGQWLEAKHGAKSRRKWRKLHLAVDADSRMIVAQTLTDQDAHDPSPVALVRLPDGGRDAPSPARHVIARGRRTDLRCPAASIRFRTATPIALSFCRAAKPRARNRGPISVL
jgi:hypothetical protein